MTAEPTNDPRPPQEGPKTEDAAPSSADGKTAIPAAARGPSRFILRNPIPRWLSIALGVLSILVCAGIWWYLTWGNTAEERILSPAVLSSPGDTLDSFHSLWFDRQLTRNTVASLRRVTLGFGLAVVVGVPLGILCGCYPWINAFFAPLTVIGRNIPVAALIPLTFSFFGIGEFQKIMFIFIACVAFIVIDSATAIANVSSSYVDTAYTLGANQRQVVLKVLVPLALPNIFDSLRLLFGLAFGYIMLAELIKFGGEAGGLGDIILTSQRRGPREHILLVLMLIPLVALAIDRVLFWIQRELFPHKYNTRGILLYFVRIALRGWENFKSLFFRPVRLAASGAGQSPSGTRGESHQP